MKKLLIIFLLFVFALPCFAFLGKKKEKPLLLFSSINPQISIGFDETIKNEDVFQVGKRIYFLVYVPEGFESEYIKYQIIKQDDKAHIGGYSRVGAAVKRIKDKNYYIDYIVLSQAGKYALQIFDITNLHHWIVYGHFVVINE